MEPSVEASLLSVMERIREATNRHDLDALANCFAADYASAFPTHPERVVGGREQLRRTWSRIFQAVPNIQSELLRWATHGTTIWAEWEWHGTLATGAPFLQRGVTIHGVEHGVTAWVRLYMEPVREDAPGIEAFEGSAPQ
ncbi:MAG: nuclear transport factor 2 family protein [Ktedonobacterales bacterium]